MQYQNAGYIDSFLLIQTYPNILTSQLTIYIQLHRIVCVCHPDHYFAVCLFLGVTLTTTWHDSVRHAWLRRLSTCIPKASSIGISSRRICCSPIPDTSSWWVELRWIVFNWEFFFGNNFDVMNAGVMNYDETNFDIINSSAINSDVMNTDIVNFDRART